MFRLKPVWIVLLAIILAASFGIPRTSPAVAQSAKAVTYDTPVEGQITDSAMEEDWTLTAPAKDRIRLHVERSGGTLAPSVELRDGNNQRIAGADVDNTYAQATVPEFTLPAGGTYTVAVSRYSGKDGKTTGNYKLTVALLGAGEDNPLVKTQPKPINFDTPTDGEITQGKWEEAWTFTAGGKDTVTVNVTRKDGTLWPELILLDSSGNPVTRASSARDGLSAKIDHTDLPGGGAFTVIVKRYADQNGASTGKYTLTVALDSAGPDRADLMKPQGAAKLNGMVNGTLTNAKWVDVWTLDAQSKDHLLITMTSLDGNLVPEITLFGANSQQVQMARANDPYNTAEMDVTLPGPGHYEIHAEREDRENGYSSGKYQMSIAVLGTGDDNPKLKTSTGEVKVGTPVTGSLTGDKWEDSYTVNFTATDPVDIILKRTSGTLVPTVKIQGANNQDLTSTGADESYAQAAITQFTIPGPGQYTIIVSRYGGEGGLTTGGYELDVNQGKKQ